MKNYIGLGVSAHDTSLAIVDKNGKLIFAEAAERPLQSKRAWGIAPDHINHVNEYVDRYCDSTLDTVVGLTWSKKFSRGNPIVLPFLNYKIKKSEPEKRADWLYAKHTVLAHKSIMGLSGVALEHALGNGKQPIERKYFDHHLTHAAAAAYASAYDEGLCVVIDGYGEKNSISAFEFRNGKFRKIEAVTSGTMASLGIFYGNLCTTCGFDHIKGEEWKVMGLAAYGQYDQRLYDLIRPLIHVDGLRLHNGKNPEKAHSALRALQRPPHVPAIEYADFAATAQFVFSETVHQLLTNIHALNISDNLILSGGCALNSSTNGTLLDSTPFKQLYVGSAPADDGNAIGAAYLAYFDDNTYVKSNPSVLSPYLGSAVKSGALEKLRQYSGIHSQRLDEAALCETVAHYLAQGKIIGWMQGRAEFGPRALGNRSILADPRQSNVKERINAQIKFREEFRPFAPSILHEHGDVYFENYQFSPYMERTLKFKAAVQEKVPGVVHVDGTGRLQSVTAALNPRYHRLISAFNALTGIPIVLNTSFNVMGKPIVHSVEDAIAVFQTCGMDVLVIEDTVFVKDTAPHAERGGQYREVAHDETIPVEIEITP